MPARVAPLAPARFGLQVTIPAGTLEKLRRARDLLADAIEPGDIAALLDRAVDARIAQVEKRKLAVTEKPREPRHEPTAPRAIPAYVRREVLKRDGHRSTFIGPDGKSCEATTYLHFDHVQPLGRGARGETDVCDGVRSSAPAGRGHGCSAAGPGFTL